MAYSFTSSKLLYLRRINMATSKLGTFSLFLAIILRGTEFRDETL